ncbi:Ran-interacting Mog1 protein [Kalmanozyma brasiliensis GHG001]|uniref:Mog1p/PsbP-like protein n=1 Tax=Kalmanozyma brasiliensis (strain GHG001) TaxID=1365824 RepID=V5ESZ1_KALBG|nr:Ran-interacting Mog1 protein [Kalmanozyma brasiliensis GHG001]EST05064.1 Ran-interacting Mog1 protein [Kalmanozyma brasiliensis GHG001]
MTQARETRALFGGAITVELPKGFIDASDFRQVPDNQEVLVRDDSDISLIIEVLQLATDEGADENLDKAVRFHFSSLAHDNSASSSTVHETHTISQATIPPATPQPATLTGTQLVRKFGKATEPEEPVNIRVALWRLPAKGIDLVLSVNEPGKTQDTPQASQAQDAFESAAASLCIRDWDLFA